MKKKKNIEIILVDKANEFVGIKFNQDKVELYVPQVFRKDENIKQDILLFLKSISLAKSLDKENLKKGDKKDIPWPIDSYLWIIRDFIENGYYYNRENTYFNGNNGKLEWKKILQGVPIYSRGNIIYDKMISSKMAFSNDIISNTYKLCLKQSLERIGWLYEYDFYVEVQQVFSVSEMTSAIKKELRQTFDDIKKIRYNHLLKILDSNEGDNAISNTYSYGIDNYYYVFEKMIDSLLGGVSKEKSKYNPNGYWHVNGKGKFVASQLRPDTILKYNEKTYIVDAKMYQYGCTHNINDLPDTQSLQKQITYGDYIHNALGDKHVRNLFFLPYNKKLEINENDKDLIPCSKENLVYLGYATVDWREKMKEYDYIYTFCIDFNYLLRNYKNKDDKLIQKLCEFIEKQIENNKNG